MVLPGWLASVARPVAAAGAAIAMGLLIHAAADFALRRGRWAGAHVDEWWEQGARRPARVLLPLIVALLAVPFAGLSAGAAPWVRRWIAAAAIAAAAWLLIRLTSVAEGVIDRRFRTDVADNLHARRIQTRTRMLRRIAAIGIASLAGALALTLFPAVREVGISLFASAGVVGLVLGIAARPTLSSMIAGIQVALSEPIRLDDVVIVEGEWGRIEEIRLTYVVVRIWDDRRLVVPLSRFLDQPFENWTRKTADLIGTVYLHADYAVDVGAVRAELLRILDGTDLWDGRAHGLQVTGASERTLELRAIMSASNASNAWNLRCHVREKLIEAIRDQQPGALPRVRASIRDAEPFDGTAPFRRPAKTARPREEALEG